MTKNTCNDNSGCESSNMCNGGSCCYLSAASLNNPAGPDIFFSDNLVPTATNTYSIGNALNVVSFVQTRQVISDTALALTTASGQPINVTTSAVIPTVDNTQDLGSVGFRWATLYCSTIGSSGLLTLAPTGNLVLNPGGIIVPAKNFVPSIDNALTLGTSSLRFSTLFALNVQAASTSNLNFSAGSGGDITASNRFRPTVTTIHDLGTATFSWQSIFCQSYLSPGQMNISGSGVDPIVISPGTSDVIVNGTIRPLINNANNVGSSTVAWQQVWANNLSSGPTTNLLLTAPVGQTVNVQRNLLPSVDNSTNLGSSGNRFSNTFSVNVTTDNITSLGNVNINPPGIIIPVRNVIPSSSNAIDLGAATTVWRTVYTPKVAATATPGVELNLAAPNGRIKLTSFDTTYLDIYANRFAVNGTSNQSSVMYSGVGTGSIAGLVGFAQPIVITFPNTDYNDPLATRTILFPTRGVYSITFYITWPATAIDINKRITFTFRESGSTFVYQDTVLGYNGSFSATIMNACFPGLLLFDMEITNTTGAPLTFTCARCIATLHYERT